MVLALIISVFTGTVFLNNYDNIKITLCYKKAKIFDLTHKNKIQVVLIFKIIFYSLFNFKKLHHSKI